MAELLTHSGVYIQVTRLGKDSLLSELLLFAGGIAVSLGYFLSVSLTDRLAKLSRAAKEVAQEHLGTWVQVTGRDEIADLARTFNDMAPQLETAAQQQWSSIGYVVTSWPG